MSDRCRAEPAVCHRVTGGSDRRRSAGGLSSLRTAASSALRRRGRTAPSGRGFALAACWCDHPRAGSDRRTGIGGHHWLCGDMLMIAALEPFPRATGTAPTGCAASDVHDGARSDAVGRELCSQSTISRLENLPEVRALMRMGRTIVGSLMPATSFLLTPPDGSPDGFTLDMRRHVRGGPRRIAELRLFNAHYWIRNSAFSQFGRVRRRGPFHDRSVSSRQTTGRKGG